VTGARKGKLRADVLLVERGLAPSRARAQAWIMAGLVRSGAERIDKAGVLVATDAAISIAEGRSPFVSRGGEKLDGALSHFSGHGLDVSGLIAVDIGASTGGFTDCLLSRAARRVYAVDVGYGLLAERLRTDPRVVVRERTNARLLEAGEFGEPIDLVVVDASFIGIGKLLPAIARILRPGGSLVALIKPQFEAGRRAAARGRGVIRDPAIRAEAIAGALEATKRAGFRVRAEVDSCIPGPKGNLEHFVYAIHAGEIAQAFSV
jgi:23S rRNA (cytidine1920-2'-O)/16S rRNA (cytidine1409-2'-O)-methyltransferase